MQTEAIKAVIAKTSKSTWNVLIAIVVGAVLVGATLKYALPLLASQDRSVEQVQIDNSQDERISVLYETVELQNRSILRELDLIKELIRGR